jgi:GNAT superfamily N-acetyltransferase
MKIIDLNEENKHLYFVCLKCGDNELKDAVHHKELWYNKMKDKGLFVKLAEDDNGRFGGMIQCIPVEYSFAGGKDLYFINCIYILGHKKAGGNFRKKGMGKALIRAAEDDAKARGAKGITAWGVSIPAFMRASWFKKHGYRKVYKKGIMVLLWKPFTEDARPPVWEIKDKDQGFELVPGKVTVTSFINGWCPAMNVIHDRAKKASAEFGDKVIFTEIDTFSKDTMIKYGAVDELFINNTKVKVGPPPSYKKIRRKIARKVRRL